MKGEKMAQWNPYYNNDSNNIPPFPTVGSDNTEQNYYGFSMNLDYNYPMQCENLNNYYYVNGMNPSYNQNNFYVYSTEPIEPQFSYNTVKNPQNDLPVSNQQNKPSIESQHPHQLYNQEFHFDTMKAGCSTVNQSSCDKPVMLGNSYFNSGMSSQNLSLTTGFTIENSTSSSDFNAKHLLRNNSYSNYSDNSKHNKFGFDKQKSKHNEFKNNLPENTEGAASNNVPLNYNSKYSYDREKNFPSKHFTNSKKGFHRRDDFDQIKHDDKKKLLRDAAEFLSSQSNNEVVNPPTPSTSNTNDNESVKQPRNYNSDRRTSMPNYYSRNYKYDTQRPNYYTKGNKAQYRNHTDDRRAQEQRNYDIKKKFGNNSVQNYPKKNKGYNDRSNYYDYDKRDYKKSEYRNDSENQRNDFSRKNFNQQRNKKSSKPSTEDNFKEKQVNLKSDDTEKEKLTQREWLTEQVLNGSLECLVCCERIRQNDSIWSCYNCFHIIHLQCVQKWATSSQADKGWRCPACQHVNNEVPMDYYCYCGEMKNPPSNTLNTPHSCGDMCGRMSRRSTCNHKCTLLCHPGPCPQCEALVVRVCGCGTTKMSVLCNRSAPLLCENSCNKMLNCGIHKCQLKCHTGDCEPCKEKIKQECYCTKCTREVNCTMETVGVEKFTCNDICGKDLLCGNHKCKKICHDKECDSCDLLPDLIKTCYCGQTKLTPEQERKSCLDPIPLCEKICSKKLQCGPSSCPHICLSKCHSGLCPPCNGNMLVRCRCGHMDRELACKKLTGQPNDARCEKKCTKKRLCGRHKCNQLCCIEIEHQCLLPCNRMLSCGKHRCEQTCHRGRCLPCYRSSFEELYCECGTSVLYPPVPCGTRRPACTQRCSRQHECNHPVLHNCHSEAECPPCSVLTHKWCYGKHEMRKTIPCHQKEFTCGRPCGKDISCGRHKCIAMCHSGICLPYNVKCTQLCKTPRPSCGHTCANVCHDGPCPDTPCKETVKVTCECGHRSTSRGCADNAKEYQRIATAMLASKMADMQLGHSIDIGDIVGNNGQKKQNSLKTLSCNDECRLIERNRRLAIGLQIRNPDLSAKLTPRYSDFMRQWGKKDPRFCQIIHDKLTELVQLAKQSKQKNRSYSFESMNHDKRHFVHEYCEHFGCESAAYDKEPNRNVVATAARDKAWLPSYSLLEVLQREAGQRKVPGPMLRAPNRKAVAESVTLKTSLERPQTRSNTMTLTNSNTSKYEEAEYVDYFDAPSDLP